MEPFPSTFSHLFSHLAIVPSATATSSVSSATQPQPPSTRKTSAVFDACTTYFPNDLSTLIEGYCVSRPRLLRNTLTATDCSLVIVPDAGKPNPEEPCSPQTLLKDPRSRVLQSEIKDAANCCFYAMNIIRPRIGKNPSPELQQQRAHEKLCSERRKQYSTIAKALPFYSADEKTRFWNKEIVAHLLPQFDTNVVKKVFNETQKSEKSLQDAIKGLLLFKQLLGQFLEQNDSATFFNFIQNLKDEREKRRYIANREFLEKAGRTPQIMAQELGLSLPYSQWSDLPYTYENDCITELYATTTAASLYGLKEAQWTLACTDVLSLALQLKQFGPLFMIGHFGHAFYSEKPILKGKMNGYEVYGWNPGTRQKNPVGHAIVVIGVEGPRGFGAKGSIVYYLDPNDASDPLSPKSRKIYAISLKSLLENAHPLKPHGLALYFSKLSGNPAATSEHQIYAYGVSDFVLKDDGSVLKEKEKRTLEFIDDLFYIVV